MCDVLLCCVCAYLMWTGLVCDGRIKSLLDNGGVLVTRVSLCLLTCPSVLGELNINLIGKGSESLNLRP